MYIEEHNHCFMLYFGVKTLSETPFPPPLLKPDYGARLLLHCWTWRTPTGPPMGTRRLIARPCPRIACRSAHRTHLAWRMTPIPCAPRRRSSARPRARRTSKPRNPRNFDGIKGGRKRVSDTFTTKTVFDACRGAQPLFHALFGVKILSGTLFAPPLQKPGYGARHAGVRRRQGVLRVPRRARGGVRPGERSRS